MILFHQQNLFASGPCRLHVGGLSLRHELQPTPHDHGSQLSAQGRSARSITQTGTLLADRPDQMLPLLDAIEDQLDGQAHELMDESRRVWPGVVMLRFTPGPILAAGPRCRVDYTIDYLQVQP